MHYQVKKCGARTARKPPFGSLLRHAQYAVIVPLGVGVESMSIAIREGRWLNAAESAGGTVAAIAVLLVGLSGIRFFCRKWN